MLFNMLPGPPIGTPLSVHAPLEPIKGRARALEHKSYRHTSSRKLFQVPQTHTSSPKFSTSNTTHSGRRILRSGGPNHSKPLCAFHAHTPLDQAFLDLPQTHPKLGLDGCIPPPGWRNPPTYIILYQAWTCELYNRESIIAKLLKNEIGFDEKNPHFICLYVWKICISTENPS
jgi:hypothetical protein